MRTWNIAGPMLAPIRAHYVGDRTHGGPWKLRLSSFLEVSSGVAAFLALLSAVLFSGDSAAETP